MAPRDPNDIVNPYLPKTPRPAPGGESVQLPPLPGPEAVSHEPAELSPLQRASLAFLTLGGMIGLSSIREVPPPAASIAQVVNEPTDVKIEVTKTCTVKIDVHGAARDQAYDKLVEGICSAAPAAKPDPKTGVIEIVKSISDTAPLLKVLVDYLKQKYDESHPAKPDPPAPAPAPTVVVINTIEGEHRHPVANAADVAELEAAISHMLQARQQNVFRPPAR